MSTQVTAAVVAVVGGIVLAVILFVPVAAIKYRRQGRLTGADLLAMLTTTVYGLALWTYTLLPLPATDDFECRESVTDVNDLLDSVRSHPHATLLDLARNPMVLQIVLNVALFVPLGFLLRVRARRGVVAAGLVGLAVSSAIELTQYTGIWGLYRCAYRYFDIGDLIANPAGALIGSIAAAVVFGRTPEPRPTVAPQLTAGRRIAAFTSDVIIVVVVSAATVVTWRAWLLIGRHVAVDDIDPGTQALVQWGVPFAFQAVAVLGWGRTLGEAAVQIRTRPRRRGWTFPGRLMKLASGIGVLTLLGAAIVPGSGWMLLGLLAAHLVAAAFTGGRGLSNFVSGLDVELTVPPDSSTET